MLLVMVQRNNKLQILNSSLAIQYRILRFLQYLADLVTDLTHLTDLKNTYTHIYIFQCTALIINLNQPWLVLYYLFTWLFHYLFSWTNASMIYVYMNDFIFSWCTKKIHYLIKCWFFFLLTIYQLISSWFLSEKGYAWEILHAWG